MITASAALQLSDNAFSPDRLHIDSILHAAEVIVRAAALTGERTAEIPVPHDLVGTIGGLLEEAGYAANWGAVPYYNGKGRPFRHINVSWISGGKKEV